MASESTSSGGCSDAAEISQAEVAIRKTTQSDGQHAQRPAPRRSGPGRGRRRRAACAPCPASAPAASTAAPPRRPGAPRRPARPRPAPGQPGPPRRPGRGRARPAARSGPPRRRRSPASTRSRVGPSRCAVGSSSSSSRAALGAQERPGHARCAAVARPTARRRPRRASGPAAVDVLGRRRQANARRTSAASASGAPSATFSATLPAQQRRPLRHPGDLGPPPLGVDVGEVHAADPDRPGIGPDEAEQHGQQRGLARPARPDQRHHLARGQVQRQRRRAAPRPPRVATRHPVEAASPRRATGGAVPRATGRRRVGPARRSISVGGGAAPPRRRGSARRAGAAAGRPRARAAARATRARAGGHRASSRSPIVHGDHRDREARGQLQHERGEERDPQPSHVARRYSSVTAAMDSRCARARPNTRSVGRPCDHVEEVVREPLEAAPLAAAALLGGQADQHQERPAISGRVTSDDQPRQPVR